MNKQKIDRLIAEDLMTEAGYASIELAKQNGSWTMIDDVENLVIPIDLQMAFNEKPEAEFYFLNLSKSLKKSLLQWIVLAKREETRKNRISEIIRFSLEKNIPKQFRP